MGQYYVEIFDISPDVAQSSIRGRINPLHKFFVEDWNPDGYTDQVAEFINIDYTNSSYKPSKIMVYCGTTAPVETTIGNGEPYIGVAGCWVFDIK